MRKVLFVLFLGLLFNQGWAAPAYPRPITIKQPDGSVITVVLKGDEHLKWAQTIDGYTVMRNNNGIYEYAIKGSNGDLVLSGKVACDVALRNDSENSFLTKIPKELFYSKPQLSLVKSIRKIRENEQKRTFPTVGTRKLVCILMGFKDQPFTKTQANFNNLFNQVGYSTEGATGSVKDYYNENSYSQFNLSVTVAGPYTSAKPMKYYGGNDDYGNDLHPEELVTEAVNAADAFVNFADFDNDNDGYVDGVYVVFAGHGEDAGASENAIWAHAYEIPSLKKDGKYIKSYSCSAELAGESGSAITPIGVICHEFGHVLGAPDYYDTDYEDGGEFDGTGDWDVMANGSWNNEGRTPAHHNAYTKVEVYKWATATDLTAKVNVTVEPAKSSKSFYKVNSSTSGEFWIMENRQKVGFDAYIPGHGLIIYHVHSGILSSFDDNDINASYPQKMYPVCASAAGNPYSTAVSYGKINDASCPFPGTGKKTSFTDATMPSMKSWAGVNTGKSITDIVETSAKTITFSFMGGGATSNAPTAKTTAATAITATGSTLNGQVNANNTSTTVSFEYGTTVSYGSTKVGTPATVAGATATNVACVLTGLVANTTYYYRVKVVSSAGTTYGTQMSFLTLPNTTGIETVSDEEFSIFPNPVTSLLTVRFNNAVRSGVISIYNIQGLLVKQWPISQNEIDVDVSDLAKGVYVISIDEEKAAIRKQFVKL